MIREKGCQVSMVGSLNMATLYPSSDHDNFSRLVEKVILELTVSIHGIDYRAAQV